jgi:type IV pilus assembly protein PilV
MQDTACRSRFQPLPTGDRGFTLIEVLLAMAIFAIGILALAGLQVSYIRGNATARYSTEATVLASQAVERLKALPTTDADLAEGSHGPVAIDGNYEMEWDVTDNTPYHNVKSIVIRVVPRFSRGRTISINYYIAEDAS